MRKRQVLQALEEMERALKIAETLAENIKVEPFREFNLRRPAVRVLVQLGIAQEEIKRLRNVLEKL